MFAQQRKGNIRIESEEEQTGYLDEGTLDQCLRVYQSIYDDAGNDITDVTKTNTDCAGDWLTWICCY